MMAVRQIDKVLNRADSARREQLQHVEHRGNATPIPRLLWLLLVITPLLVGCTLLVPIDLDMAFVCWAAAGVSALAWPWIRLYWAMRENGREHPEERQRPWWQRWPWGSPHPPEPKTRLDRVFDVVGIVSATGLGLMVLAWFCGIL